LTSEKLFNTIKDGSWHHLNELADQIGTSIDRLVDCTRILSDQGIVTYEENTQRIKIKPEWKTRLPEENPITTTKTKQRQTC